MSEDKETVKEVVSLYANLHESSNRVWAIESSARDDLAAVGQSSTHRSGEGDASDNETEDSIDSTA